MAADPSSTQINADLVINVDGNGGLIEKGCVVISGSKIAYVGKQGSIPPNIAEKVGDIVNAEVVMPGMWDCHTHLLGLLDAKIEDHPKIPFPTKIARCIRCLELALECGFTSVREVAGYGIDLVTAEQEGSILSPTIYSSGQILSPTAGHADFHCIPYESQKAHEKSESAVTHTCDGVPECLRAVRLQLRKNAKCIKICCSGGVLSEVDHIDHQQFSSDEIAAITSEAHRHRRAVAAHCHGVEGIKAFLKYAESDVTVEHASFFDEECAKLADNRRSKDQLTVVVPTFYVVSKLLERSHLMPVWAVEKAQQVAANHAQAITLAHKCGIPIALGTDSFSYGSDSASPWGFHGEELKLMCKNAGMSPIESIVAATSNGPKTLGPSQPNTGVLKEGADADVITVQGNPLNDIGVLGDRNNVRYVWKKGKMVKNDGTMIILQTP